MINLISNNIELLIDEKFGVISSLKLAGIERSVDKTPVFVARLRDKAGECAYIDATTAKSRVVLGNDIIFNSFEAPFQDISVALNIVENNGIEWRINIKGIPQEYALEWVEVAKVCLPKLIENNKNGGRVLFPYNEGMIISNENLLPRYAPEFPSSGAYFMFPNMMCSQFMAYLFDDVSLYMGAHDTKRGLKVIDFYPQNDSLVFTIRPYSGLDFGQDYISDFPVVWRSCDGNWKSACEIYRSWFENNLPSNLTPISVSKDIPYWYEASPLVVTYPVRGIHDMDKMEPNALFPYTNALPILNEIKNATNTPIMALLMHWEGTAPWAPPYCWPPFGGVDVFNEFRDALHANGDLLGVYCSGFGYTLRSTLIESYNCEEKIKSDNVLSGVCHSPANKPELGITCCPYQRYGYDICPASDRGRQILDEAYAPIFESGVDYAQILDQNHGGGQYLCYAREHNHPPMPGEWMTENMITLLSNWNSLASPMLFGCESGASEPFIGNLKMSDNRYELNYPFGTPVPLYAYIYHEYVRNFMGNQCGCPFEPSCDTLRYRLAYSFSIGDIMSLTLAPNGDLMTHWGTHDFENAPNKDKALLFIKNVMRFYNDNAKEYLYSGKMCIAPEIKCDEITIPLFRGQKTITLPRLLSSAWVAKNGKVAYIVVNPEDVSNSFTIGNDKYEVSALNATLIIR